ncbi:MAG: hypothetical protein ACXABG_08775 [Promethearchaeota archaeon]
MPQNLMYSFPPFKSILSSSKEIADLASFFLTPCIFDEAVLVFGLNSLGSRFIDSLSVILANGNSRSSIKVLHFGHLLSFGYGFTILYPQFLHMI